LSIPIASQVLARKFYIRLMARRKHWEDWGTRFRNCAREKGMSTRSLAEKIGLAESSVRSWINGTREINLTDFFQMCEVAGIDPATVLFAERNDPRLNLIGKVWVQTDERGKEVLLMAAEVARRYAGGSETAGNNVGPPRR
jgi:transcriptional regulator with XRE-family HTH domain